MNNVQLADSPRLTANNSEIAIIEKKRSSWAMMGERIYKQELELQVRAQDALAKLSLIPKTIDEVPQAEARLKEVTALRVQLVADRKAITSKFDPVVERLMAPEKSFAGPLQSYTAAIIAIKQEEAKKELERRMRSDEMSRIRQAIITALARHDAEFRTLIEERVGQAFSHALEKGIKPEEIEDYCGRVIFKVKESHYFEALYPKFTPVYTSGDEVKATIDELWKLNPADYLATFTQELTKKFSDYEVSYLNKLEALAQASLGQERRLREIEEEKNQRVAAAELDAHATDMSVEVSGVKALKKAYEVDMDETFDNAMKILSAFMANKQKCIEKTNVKKWFSFDASSAAKALAKVKSDDNAFAPVGIVWKEIDKL